MGVQVFRGPSIVEVLGQIQKRFGAEAVIVSLSTWLNGEVEIAVAPGPEAIGLSAKLFTALGLARQVVCSTEPVSPDACVRYLNYQYH